MPEHFIADKEVAPTHDPVYLATTYACGERGDHVAEVERSKWPPKSLQGLNPALVLEKPHVATVCKRCGVNLIVYDPPSHDMTVVLVEDKPPVGGGERNPTAGTVVDIKDAQRSKGGKVVGG